MEGHGCERPNHVLERIVAGLGATIAVEYWELNGLFYPSMDDRNIELSADKWSLVQSKISQVSKNFTRSLVWRIHSVRSLGMKSRLWLSKGGHNWCKVVDLRGKLMWLARAERVVVVKKPEKWRWNLKSDSWALTQRSFVLQAAKAIRDAERLLSFQLQFPAFCLIDLYIVCFVSVLIERKHIYLVLKILKQDVYLKYFIFIFLSLYRIILKIYKYILDLNILCDFCTFFLVMEIHFSGRDNVLISIIIRYILMVCLKILKLHVFKKHLFVYLLSAWAWFGYGTFVEI